jgi:PKD domain-containing protein/Big-like domain-containing protein
VAAIFAAALALVPAMPAAGADSVDQHQDTMEVTPGQGIPFVAQSFTPSASGQLTMVSIGSRKTSTTALRVSVRDTDQSTGKPSGSDLATAPADSGTWAQAFRDFRLSTPLAVTGGHVYAIVLQAPASGFFWYYSSNPASYAGGQLSVCGSACTNSANWNPDTRAMDLAFRAWTAGASPAPNVAPTVQSDSRNVIVNEGAAPTMQGSYQDADGDTVALTSSSGSVVRTSGTSNGRWTWTGAAADEGAQTITISANDGHGHTTAAQPFTVTVIGVKPTLTVTGPTSVAEGSTMQYTGTSWSPDASDRAGGFTYGWYVTKNGVAYGTDGTASSFSFSPDDDGAYVITFEATDDGQVSNEQAYPVTGTNVDPTATITGVSNTIPIVLTTGENVTFSGSFTDPGVKDTHTATWSWGDGSSSAAQDLGQGGTGSFSAVHNFLSAGLRTVTLTVADDDGGHGTAAVNVNVMTTAQALDAISGYLGKVQGLNKGQLNSLQAKLDAAKDSFSKGNSQACNNQLAAFLNELMADAKTGKVSATDANNLALAVNTVRGSLGTYNRFLEWLPLAI